MTFDPAPSRDGWRALGVGLALAVLDSLIVILILNRSIDGVSFLLLIAALALLFPIAYLSWRAWACLSLSYWIDRNAVTVVWGPLRQVIPMGKIARLERGSTIAPPPLAFEARPQLARALHYGPDLGRTWIQGDQSVTSLASRPAREQLLLATDEGAFGLSPADPAAFLKALEEHHQLGPTRLLALEQRRPAITQWHLWRDRIAIGLLAGGLAVVLVQVGTLFFRYPTLPRSLDPSSTTAWEVLLLLPVFGLAVWLINGIWGALVFASQRLAAYLLWSGALMVELVTLVALVILSSG